jgi:hypothetical protein
VYYINRSLSRLRSAGSDGIVTVSFILDGMDQAKFSFPRSSALQSSKEFEWAWPRLHVLGCVVHGYFRQIFVTDSDVPKDSNLTLEILSVVLTNLAKMNVRVTDVRLCWQAVLSLNISGCLTRPPAE